MRLVSMNFNSLMSLFSEIGTIINDSSVPTDMQNIIFKVEGTQVKVMGITKPIVHKLLASSDTLYAEDVNAETDVLTFQLSAKALMSHLNSYKSLATTVVSRLTFEFDRNNVIVTVYETDKANTSDFGDFNENPVEKHSTRHFNLVALKPALSRLIDLEYPSDVEPEYVDASEFMSYFNELTPVIRGGSGVYGNIYFADDYVVANHQNFVTYFKNTINSSIFKGISFSEKVATFLNKSFATGEGISVSLAKTSEYVCIHSDEFDTFVAYSTNIINYSMFLSAMDSKENGVAVDRIYLKDVLKRCSNDDEAVRVTIKPDSATVELRNTHYSQDIYATNMIGFESEFKFSVRPEILSKAIVDIASAEGIAEMYIYAVQFKGNSIVILTDITGSWYSVIRVGLLK